VRYLISGYYGEGNAGDEAILAGMLQELRMRDPEAECKVLSFDPVDTTARHRVVSVSTSLRHPGLLAGAMLSADLLISGGGSILHEADFALYGRAFLRREGKLRPVPYFLSVVMLAHSLGLPVMWYAQGLGPLHTRPARRLVGLAGSRCAAVTWRDPASARLAYEVGVRSPIQLVVPDPAYALQPRDSLRVRELMLEQGIRPDGPFVAVCPRPWLGRVAYQEHLARAVGLVAAEEGLEVLLVPFQERTDGPLCCEMAAHPSLKGRTRVLTGIQDPAVLAGILGEAAFAVTMRLHACILAAAAGTPAVVVDYDPKVRAFAEQTGQAGFAVTADALESVQGEAALAEAARITVRTLVARRAALERRVAPLRAEAGRTAGLAVGVAACGGVPGMPRASRRNLGAS
jgi:polysaccharide pyruvyl transferase CsaB